MRTLTLPRQFRRTHDDIPPAAPAAPVADLWHVSVTRPGLFPMAEARCPCKKARCGHVIPMPDVICPVHNSECQVFQAHRSSQCRKTRPGWKPGWATSLRGRATRAGG